MGHIIKTGVCPKVTPEPNFDMGFFSGQWNAIYETLQLKECLRYDFIYNAGTSKHELKIKNPLLTLTGTLKVKDTNLPANMTLKFPIIPKSVLTVVTTDNVTYAGIFDCYDFIYNLTQFHRQSVTFLARAVSLSQTIVDTMNATFNSFPGVCNVAGMPPDSMTMTTTIIIYF
ncbi:CLUMA_CG019192, isoform A [Clunio marinus]|uniref:CLUMA_CG019192, isoform A n=1 Tax=Clunio marinus TaxID=568069 RepID=A0A1J1J151_9DIPT|nr:CLUMA_CG019192, isoform A [Clunio marinus]